jgi:hypothetical protein
VGATSEQAQDPRTEAPEPVGCETLGVVSASLTKRGDAQRWHSPQRPLAMSTVPSRLQLSIRLSRFAGEPEAGRLDRLEVVLGWRCLEVDAGLGSIARWLGTRIGQQGGWWPPISTAWRSDHPTSQGSAAARGEEASIR